MSALPGCEWRDVPLRDCQLIEASAGTGKTYTLVLLVLRALLETDTRIEQIVVTTYTRAAAQQLKTRLRAQLDATLRVLEARDPDTSPFAGYLATRVAALGEPEVRRRVRAALLSLELACIDTLHAVCARILRDEPLAAPMACEGEALDARALGRECLEDFWRARVLSATPAEGPDCSVLLECGFEYVARAAAPLLECGTVEFVAVDHAVEQLRCAHFAGLRDAATLQALREVLDDARSEFRLNTDFAVALQALLDALAGDARHFIPAPALRRDLAEAAQHKTRRKRSIGEVPAIAGVWQLASFEPGAARARTAAAIELLVSQCRVEMKRRARARDGYTFADLIDAVATALAGEGGDALAARLRARWPIALIDEFQDTDTLQYGICMRIWSHADATLLLIGDPKQAIYAFRGADLHAYLAAAAALPGEPHRLRVNQRSSTALVDAVNAFYVDAGVDPFAMPMLRFEAVRAGGRADATPLLAADGAGYAPLRVHVAPEQAWARGALDRWCLERCADDIAASLAPGGPVLGGEPLDPGHIAVLLPAHRHVAELRALLRARGVPCVGGGRASVYRSPAAAVLITLLRALLAPGDAAQWRAVLATGLFGANLSDFDAWRLHADSWSREVDRQQHLSRRWQEQGIGGLLAPLLAARSAAVLAVEDGERLLTDLRHLLELLAHEEAVHDGPRALLTHLERMQRDDDAASTDECSLRLEGDSNRVKLLTLHASKGLEFDIVYLPLAWRLGLADTGRREPVVLALHDESGRAVRDAGSAAFDSNEAAAQAEAHAEQLRLLYVALTRARHACHVFWGSIAPRAGAQPGAVDAHLARLARRFGSAAGAPTWQAFASAHPRAVALADAPVVAERWRPRTLPSRAVLDVRLDRPPRPRRWAVHSFTRIVRDSGHRFDAASAAPAEDETLVEETPDAAAPIVATLRDEATVPIDPIADIGASGLAPVPHRWRAWHGTAFGNALHQSLERLDWREAIDPQEPVLRTALRDHGIGAQALPALHALAQRTLAVPLFGDGTALRDLGAQDRVAELRFDFPLRGAQLSRWPALFAMHGCADLLPDLPALAPLEGLLTGAADLVFRHQGRYYLADYKSNDLGDAADAYRGGALLAAMQRGHYGLQLTLYQLALHRHLRQRLRGYDYARDCGGALYLFVRGLAGDDGVFRACLPRALIDALDADCAGGSTA